MQAGLRTLCPVLVGRTAERAALVAALDAAARGTGAALALVGEAGIGKTRLVREAVDAARERSATALVGRNLEHGQAPYRPLTEALFTVARAGPLPDAPALRPFRHALGTLVPDWREVGAGGGEVSPLIVGEGVLRLARVLAGPVTLVVVEDLHWADADTVAVVEYLADNVAGLPVVLLLTARAPGGAAADLLARLAARGALRRHELGRLPAAEVAAMVGACAGRAVDAAVVATVADRSEGLPLLVEELLPVAVTGDADAVPATFADAIGRRVGALPAGSALVVECAAVLGGRFDWRLLPAVTGLDEAAVRRGLADGVDVALLATGADGGVRFRHALTRDAVLARMLAPTRVALARRAARAVDRDGGGGADDGGDRALLAAELWCAAGEPGTAARGLVGAGRAATARGALTAAERLLERARDLATDPGTRTAAAEAATEALALAARVDAALAAGAEALALLDAAAVDAPRRARLHLVLARAAAGATRWPLAAQHLDRARALAATAALRAAVDALSAHVAMGERRHDEAAALAATAAEEALRLDLPEVACEALEVLGRRERLRDLARAVEIFARGHAIAQAAGLPLWTLRALHELGTIDMLERTCGERLRRAGELAYRAGALSLAATVDLQLIGLHAFVLDTDAAIEAGERVIGVAGPLGLVDVHATALVQLGFAYAVAGRRAAMEESVAAGLRLAGDNPETVAMAWGHARATASLLAEDRDRAREELATAMAWAGRAPGVTGVFTAVGALLRVVDGAGPEAVDEVGGFAAQALPANRAILAVARAVHDARAGEAAEAGARVESAVATLTAVRMDLWHHLVLRLVAEPALDGGWGRPRRWLADAEAFFTGSGHERVAAACRDLLRRSGGRVRRSGPDGLPPALRAAGVTAREAEVLGLVAERLSNREIAQRLYLSPRTVEKHVERLLQKTGAATRTDLGRLGRAQAPEST